MRRFIVPPAIVIGLMAVSILVYDHGVSLVYGLSGTARLLVDLGAAGMFMTVWMGAFISHPLAFFAGAGVKERVAAGIIPGCAWIGKMLFTTSCVYSGRELAYFIFYPLALNAFAVSVMNTGISEIVCSLVARRPFIPATRAFKPWAIAMIVVGSAILALSLAGGGIHYFYLFVDIYTSLFT